MRRLTKSLEEVRNDSVNLIAIGTSLEIDDKAHNKDILLLLVGSNLVSFFSFFRLDVFCRENKNNYRQTRNCTTAKTANVWAKVF